MPPDPPRLGVLRTPSLSTFINHHASKGPLLVKKNPPFKIPGYGPEYRYVCEFLKCRRLLQFLCNVI